VLAIGPSENVTDFVAACRHGPRAAQVMAVSVAEAEDDGSLGFRARPTK